MSPEREFPLFRQAANGYACGPLCLRMVAAYYGKNVRRRYLSRLCRVTAQSGALLVDLQNAARQIGFAAEVLKCNFAWLSKVTTPCIVLQSKHYVVVYSKDEKEVHCADPIRGYVSLPINDFMSRWQTERIGEHQPAGVLMTLSPTPSFFDSPPGNHGMGRPI